uniref:Uncharacterized protein n=1 Tax=Anguilla anguilla TaxID=7936 RepID=A0A0E9SNF8_ANGAN
MGVCSHSNTKTEPKNNINKSRGTEHYLSELEGAELLVSCTMLQ